MESTRDGEQELVTELDKILAKAPLKPKGRPAQIMRNAQRVKAIEPDLAILVNDAENDKPAAELRELAARQSLQWVKRAEQQHKMKIAKEAGSWVLSVLVGLLLVGTIVLVLFDEPRALMATLMSAFRI